MKKMSLEERSVSSATSFLWGVLTVFKIKALDGAGCMTDEFPMQNLQGSPKAKVSCA